MSTKITLADPDAAGRGVHLGSELIVLLADGDEAGVLNRLNTAEDLAELRWCAAYLVGVVRDVVDATSRNPRAARRVIKRGASLDIKQGGAIVAEQVRRDNTRRASR